MNDSTLPGYAEAKRRRPQGFRVGGVPDHSGSADLALFPVIQTHPSRRDDASDRPVPCPTRAPTRSHDRNSLLGRPRLEVVDTPSAGPHRQQSVAGVIGRCNRYCIAPKDRKSNRIRPSIFGTDMPVKRQETSLLTLEIAYEVDPNDVAVGAPYRFITC